MHDTLKRLYDRFYTPLPMEEAEQEIETCHQQLIERLEKPERKLVLRIMDAQGLIAEERSVDSFLCGFKLAWELAYELNHFEMDRHPSPKPVSDRSKTVSGICFRYFRPKLVVPKYASKLATGSTTQSESSGLLAR